MRISFRVDEAAVRVSTAERIARVDARSRATAQAELDAQVQAARAMTPVRTGRTRAGWRGVLESRGSGVYVGRLENDTEGAEWIERRARGEFRPIPGVEEGIVAPVQRAGLRRLEAAMPEILKEV